MCETFFVKAIHRTFLVVMFVDVVIGTHSQNSLFPPIHPWFPHNFTVICLFLLVATTTLVPDANATHTVNFLLLKATPPLGFPSTCVLRAHLL